ncbi:MAG: L-lactate permease [Lachnospiraceae bacterium]
MYDFGMFLLAISPILWLIVALTIFRMQGHYACLISFGITVILGVFVWHMRAGSLVSAILEGVVMAIWPISLVIIAAIFTYNLCLHTGAMDVIKKMLMCVSEDKRVLVLLVAWGFGGFMEGMAGFGTAVAIPAGMLVTMGFEPIFSAVVCLIANSTPTMFGSIGIPTVTLSDITGLDVRELGFTAVLQVAPLILCSPFFMTWLYGNTVSEKGKGSSVFQGIWHVVFGAGLGYLIPEMACAKFLGPELANIFGAFGAMISIILLSKVGIQQIPEEYRMGRAKDVKPKLNWKEAVTACSPFLLIFLFLILSAIPAIKEPLEKIATSIQIYQGEGAKPTTFRWLTAPGMLIFLSAVIGGKIQKASFGEIGIVLWESIRQMAKTVVAIVSIVALAKIMGYSGMIGQIATVVVAVTGSMYPLFAPFIGSIGSFVTGSGTNASLLFGGLQQQTAQALGFNEVWICAANAVGADAGKMISPQTIAIAVAAIHAPGVEGKIMSKSIRYYLLFVVVMGLICFLGLPLIS